MPRSAEGAKHHPIFHPFNIAALGVALTLGSGFGVLAADIQANTQDISATSQRLREVADILAEIRIAQATAKTERAQLHRDIERLTPP